MMSEELDSWLTKLPSVVNANVPRELKNKVTQEELDLMHYVYLKSGIALGQDKGIKDEWLQYAKRRMDGLMFKLEDNLNFPSAQKISSILNKLSDVLQAKRLTLPQMEAYQTSLSTIREYKLKAVARHLVDNHKWANLPKPAEFHLASKHICQSEDEFLTRVRFAQGSYANALKYRNVE